MVVFDHTQAPGKPATAEGARTHKGGLGATIAAVIACLLILPWVLLFGATAVALFILSIEDMMNSLRFGVAGLAPVISMSIIGNLNSG